MFGVWRDFRLAYFNRAWDAFAEANGGQPAIRRDWDLGACYFDAIPEPLLRFYRDLFERAAAPGAGLRPITHAYECSSAEILRRFVMQIFALPEQAGFVVVNSPVIEAPQTRQAHPPLLARYVDRNGLVHQCSHCRRMQSAEDPAVWEWVPAWVERPQVATSHSLCAICLAHYYPGCELA